MSSKVYTAEFYKSLKSTSSPSAIEVVPMVIELVQPKSVIDMGCGVGSWLSVFKELGVSEVVGVDGSWVKKDMLLIDDKNFIQHDLTKPLKLNKKFDLVVSLEVAEHIPKEYAEAFVENLTSQGPVILFSAAIPFQGGTDHINEQWPDYWASYFKAKGYEVIDCLRGKIWENECIDLCYIQNIMLFVDSNFLKEHQKLNDEYQKSDASRLSIVHPRQHIISATSPTRKTLENIGFKLFMSSFPNLIINTIRRKLTRK